MFRLLHVIPFLFLVAFTQLALVTGASGQGFKQLPPAGIEVDPQVLKTLSNRVKELQLRTELLAEDDSTATSWRPDVEVLVRAVRLALTQGGFYKQSETAIATKLLDEAERRLKAVAAGERGLVLLGLQAEVVDRPQLLVGGFRSRIDDSVQPYGAVIPAGFAVDDAKAHRVDVWLHGRGDTKTELAFLDERMNKLGQYTPADTVVLHPFGRHCNAFKFAGETDVYESIDHLGTVIRVDPRKLAIRGFSMGGAGCWHLAVHNPGAWFAANPGAGFVDTIVYQGWDKSAPYELSENRLRLMKWYDVLPWVSNLSNTHTVAYSGEVDKQKQAADRVMAAAAEQGIQLDYVIGAGMAHKIDPDSGKKVDEYLASWAEEAKPSPRREIDFVTYTLRYHRLDWLTVTGLQEHWTPGRVKASIVADRKIEITSSGVSRLQLDFRDSPWPSVPGDVELTIDGQTMAVQDWDEAAGIQVELQRSDRQGKPFWSVVEVIDESLRKRPGIQGPIDDAFCDRFLFVTPSRPASHGVVERWIDREFQYAQLRWQRLMRGEVRVVQDKDLTEDDIRSNHLICFGDFSGNQYLREIASQLPIEWNRDDLRVGLRHFDPTRHAAVFCFPNPRNPNKYVVVNSGMTFREFSNVSNSRQIAMLPDWAVMDVSGEDDGIFAGQVVADGFFNEQWQLVLGQSLRD